MSIRCDPARLAGLQQAARERRENGHIALESSYYLDAFLAHLDQPAILREARALASLWAQQEIVIYPDEVIVGRLAMEPFAFHSGGGIAVWGRLRSAVLGQGEEAGVPPTLLAKLRRAWPYVGYDRTLQNLSSEDKEAMEAGIATTQFSAGHILVDFERVLQVGVRGLAEAVAARGRFGGDDVDPVFLSGLTIAAQALSTLIARHAEQARALAAVEHDPCRREELAAIAERCDWLAHEPPRSFLEALQLTWFVHMAAGLDSFGRFDQYLWRHYQRDVQAGRLTRPEALYLLQLFWLKILEGAHIQNMTLGGCDRYGEEASNELTELCLEATRTLVQPQPNLCLRLSSRSPDALVAAALQTVAVGMGAPAVYNDDVIIPALRELGVPAWDANNYALAGCSQVMIPGQSHWLCDDGLLNAAKCLELALHNGLDPRTGKQVGPQTGTPEALSDFDALMTACRRQIAHAATVLGRCVNTTDRTYAGLYSQPMRSLLMSCCLPAGKDIWHGGAAYNGAQAECVGITNTADSLLAIKRLVYEEQQLSLREFVEILDRDWEGQEALALYCRNQCPKFGNDNDEVDGLYRQIAETVYQEVRSQEMERGGIIIPGSVVFLYHTHCGKITGASADGRHAGSPLADSAGASQGANRCGPTGLINSMTKFDQSQGLTCVVLNILFARSSFQPEAVAQLVRTYFRQGGMQMQFNVLDQALLRQAQERPQEFRHLAVRVGGYSAYFCELSRDLQDEILAHAVLI